MKHKILFLVFTFFLISCSNNENELRKEVDEFLSAYNKTFQELYTASAEAEWKLNTKIVEGDTVSKTLAAEVQEKFAAFTGSKTNIETARKFLESKSLLTPLQIKQLETILYYAGSNPEVASDIVKEKITIEKEQVEKLFGFDFMLNGKSISTNDIDNILRTSNNLLERLKAWESSKEVGKGLKPGMVQLQELRNKSVQALGYSDFFNYQVSEYGMTTEEMLEVCKNIVRDIWPLYREIHTWARYTLANQYNQPVPEFLPAHWVPNRWGQDWLSLVEVEGIDVDKKLKEKSAEWIVKEGEQFYISLGFPPLPESFYEKSSLYPLSPDAGYKKNNHASAWHMDRENDIRSLMSVQPNSDWWATTLHELGHIYYYICYTNPDVPIILREGANRAYHEAIGSLMGLASLQKPFLEGRGLIEKGVETDEIKILLKEALEHIVFMPWAAGVMTEFEYELYAKNLPENQFNKRWWELVKQYQGIVPPSERGEEFNDGASKTHITDDAAQYYDYALSVVLLFQFHDHISNKILKQNPRATDYYGNKETGDFLKAVMTPGASVDWRKHLKEQIGSEMSAKAMLNYFTPLLEYLKKENEGRFYSLPENFQ